MKNISLGIIAALALSVTSATAATLSFTGTGQTSTIDDSVARNNIKVGGTFIAPDGTVLDMITGDQKSALNGLSLVGGAARITYTFLGSEGFNTNYAAKVGSTIFTTDGSTAKGATSSVIQHAPGLLDFAFGTSAPAGSVGEIMNNGGAVAPGGGNLNDFAIAYVKLSDTSFYALFDDIAQGDRDFDDIAMRIDIAAVPLPAGGLLLLSGVAGAAFFGRRKRKA